jgi:hypothetical protein
MNPNLILITSNSVAMSKMVFSNNFIRKEFCSITTKAIALRLSSFFKYLFLVTLLTISMSFGQQKDPAITLEPAFNIRQIAFKYFGDADLWRVILKHNNVKDLSNLKEGSTITIPQNKVNQMLRSLENVNKSIQRAVDVGAKVLAAELLTDAESIYKKSLKQKELFEIESSTELAKQAIASADKAYKQTIEIRDKTIDAIVTFKKGTLQKRFSSALAWQSADLHENLRENDVARTLTLSMARITFHDLSQIKLNENSQAVIQRTRVDALTNKSSSKIKIEKGDAYAMLLNSPKKDFSLEIPGVKTKINSKYFWVEKGTSDTKLANYNGEITLEANNKTVVVQKNQGSVISQSGTPSDAKDLLPPPNIISPADMQNVLSFSQEFVWTAVNGAKSYWIEIGLDFNFKTMYDTRKNITETRTVFNNFQKGVYYWRVCSVDNSGLPGPYTDTRYFVVSPDNNKPFISVEFPPNNFSTKEKNLRVSGKTSFGNKMFINQNESETGLDGSFTFPFSLIEGKNDILIKATNNSTVESLIRRTVFYESNPRLIIINESGNEINDNSDISLGGISKKLILKTRALSSIEINAKNGSWRRIGYADTLGNCDLILPVITKKEPATIKIKSPAGYERFISINLIPSALKPEIILLGPAESVTNCKHISFTGYVKNGNALFLNDQKVELGGDNSFNFEKTLDNSLNIVELKAVNSDGDFSKLEKRIVLDNTAPKLISHKIQKDNANNFLYKITIKAEDVSPLRKTAEVELQISGFVQKEVLRFNEQQQIYEGFVSVGRDQAPVIKKIVLHDFLLNTETYQISK